MKARASDYDVAAIIGQSCWFKALPEESLARLVDAAHIRSYEKKSYLYTSGKKVAEIYCILSGQVRLLLTSAIGQQYAVTDDNPGTWLGGEFLSGDHAARLDAQVNKATTVLVLPRALVLDLADQHPQVFKSLFADYMTRFAGLMQLLQGMAFYPLRARLAGWILELLDKHGKKEDAGIYLDIRLSQNDLALLSLGSRPRVNMILSEWRERGIIEVEGSRYLIRDTNALLHETELRDRDD